jgi:photosystem II stability/assembly factor-like uncharacterized protein
MGVDPADGHLYLGTHVGTMRVTEAGVEQVGRATLDLMGFAVAGPGHFYASGHPGPLDDLPDPVGLVESTDGGRTWTRLSRAGESDFHVVGSGDGRVYAFDGVLRRTDEGTAWTELAPDVVPASLAVHPDDRDVVVATTQHGPLRSTDGGATFAPLEGAPLLVFVSWATQADLWAVAPDGSVHHSADAGTTWHKRGSAGAPPQAFTAAGADRVVVAVEGRIVQSTDGGATFEELARRR